MKSIRFLVRRSLFLGALVILCCTQAAPIAYTINFTAESGPAPAAGTFIAFFERWDGSARNIAAEANAGQSLAAYRGRRSGGAQIGGIQ